MDRNSLIGLGLIAVIMIAWFQLMKPEPKQQDLQNKNRIEAAASAIDSAATQPLDSATAAQNKAFAELGQFGQFATGSEKDVKIETDLFTAILSSKGATLKSFVQKKHLDFNYRPFDMVSAKQGATSLLFVSREGKVINSGKLYFNTGAKDSVYKISGDQQIKIPFAITTPDGKKVEIVYTFSGNSYQIGFETNLAGLGQFVSGNEYQIVWTGGITNAQKSKVDEADNSSADAYLGGSLLKVDAKDINETFKEQPSGKAEWVAVRNKYFVAAIVANEETEGIYMEGKRNTNDEKQVFEDYTAALKLKLPSDKASVNNKFVLYVGPLDYEQVKAVGHDFEKVMDFGWEWVTRPFAEYLIIPIFNFLNGHITNYGIIIIIFALFIKVVTYPFTMASTKSMKKMASLQPQLKDVQEKYKDNPQKLQVEIANIYRQAGVNPLSGCLPTLIQMPLLFAMFYVFRSSIQLRQESFLWANDLSVPDSILDLPFSLPLYGDHISVIPILMGVSVYVQQKITPSTQTNDQLKFMLYLFPVMMLFFFNNMPAGLGLYYLMFNIFGIIQQFYINQTAEKLPVVVTNTPKQGPKGKKKGERVA
ncbi:MAG: membrane protein insertase YidC [Chlorobiales bacterium]|nr:membrane protein insertase YidC [Chlorobiales bacterium]